MVKIWSIQLAVWSLFAELIPTIPAGLYSGVILNAEWVARVNKMGIYSGASLLS